MAIPEGYLPRKGDVLVLHATVRHDVEHSSETVFLTLGGDDLWAGVKLKDVAGIKRRTWKRGDLVRSKAQNKLISVPAWTGTVIATSGDAVWVEVATHGFGVLVHCNEIDALPTPSEDLPEAPETPPFRPDEEA